MWFFAFSRAVFTEWEILPVMTASATTFIRYEHSSASLQTLKFKHTVSTLFMVHPTHFPSVWMWYIFIPSSLYFSLPVSSFFCIFSFSSSMLPTWFIFFAPLHHVVFFSSFISSHCCSFTSPSLPFLLPCIFLHFFLLSLEPQFRKPIWSIRRWSVQQSGPRH